MRFCLLISGSNREHLSVLEYKKEQRTQELAELEQTIRKVQQQQVSLKAVEQIEFKSLPLTSKVVVEREEYDKLVTAAQKYVVQEKKEGKLKKLLKEARATIADLTDKLSAALNELAALKSIRGGLRTAELEQENGKLKEKVRRYENIIEHNGLWNLFVHPGKTPQMHDKAV